MYRYVRAGLLGVILAAVVCFLPSVFPGSRTIIIEGQLFRVGEYGNNVSVPIYLSQEPFFGNRQRMHKIRTAFNGHFQTEFAVRPNNRVYLYVMEDGYTPVRQELVLQGSRRYYNMQRVFISKLFDYDPYLNHTSAHTNLQVYKDSCAQQPHALLSCQRVSFFENLRPVSCRSPLWEGNVIIDNRRIGPDYFIVDRQ